MDFKFRKIADDKFNNGANELKLHNWVDNNVGQRENAGFQHFILFSTLLLKASFTRVGKIRVCLDKGLSQFIFNVFTL